MRANSKRLAYRFGWENIALDFKNLYESMTENK
jgi:glycosyltransferase involved in cell wall biosynthesis